MSGYVWIFPDDHKMIRYIDDIYVADDSESSKLFLYEILDKDHLEHPESPVETILGLSIYIRNCQITTITTGITAGKTCVKACVKAC